MGTAVLRVSSRPQQRPDEVKPHMMGRLLVRGTVIGEQDSVEDAVTVILSRQVGRQ